MSGLSEQPEQLFKRFQLEKVVVKGTSMLPLLHGGDLAELELVRRESLVVGDVIAFTDARKVRIIHRVIALNPLQTQGDNRFSPDEPVPEDCDVFRAVAMIDRKNARKPIVGGLSGRKIFQRHQRRFRIMEFARRCVSFLATCNPAKKPFAKLKKSVFSGSAVYYSGKRPVGWIDVNGWHWKGRFDRIFIHGPSLAEVNDTVGKLNKTK